MSVKPILCAFGLLACGLSTSATTTIPTLTLTEKSSTELLWSWDGPGGPFSGTAPPPPAPDYFWSFVVPIAPYPFFDFLLAFWEEPGEAGVGNQVHIGDGPVFGTLDVLVA